MKKRYLALIVLICSCTTQKNLNKATLQSDNLVPDGKLFNAVFQQQAAEYRALCFQAYNIATLRLNEILKDTSSTMPKAIVTDIDETILDNSKYAVHQGLMGKDYDTQSWVQWTSLADADTLAGALTFFKYAASRGVEVFYITNRAAVERTGTLKNLQKFGFPYADESHLITKQDHSSKEERRMMVAKTHNIVLLVGDNLSDFSALFDKKSVTERELNTQKSAALFGSKFIVLPNSGYGDWEGVLYNYKYGNYTIQQRDSILKNVLKTY
ncbi:MAG: Lipoprotein E [Bacteroidia bacterium]|nr:Lipoprotein E [Bacteroidia bacterium]MCE7954912.1 5'-nucleotidase, lipoprotein e(P4) family [Bacteroidetes bacterium CHB6]HRV53143.1 5'-nucleotidase, lipoprotein e(P4) family [Bacteroidia bacterium]